MTRRAATLSAWLSMVAALVTSGAWAARAQAPSAPGADVSIEVLLIYGSADDGGGISPELSGIQEYLQRSLPMRFGTLQTFDRRTFEMPLGQIGGLPLPTGSQVRFMPIAIVDGRLHMHLEMPGIMNTRLQVQSGRPVIVGGPRYDNGLVFVELKPTFDAGPGRSIDPIAPDLTPEVPGKPPGAPPSRVVQQPNPLPPKSQSPPVTRVGAPSSR